MRGPALSVILPALMVILIAPGCSARSSMPSSTIQRRGARNAYAPAIAGHAALGKEVFSKFGGSIFGWDIDRTGDDGLLSETVTEQNGKFLNAIETFDERTDRITSVVRKWTSNADGPFPFVDAITANDLGLIDDQRIFFRNGQLHREDEFPAVDPVIGKKITGSWSPGHVLDLEPSFVTENPGDPRQVMTAIRSEKNGVQQPVLYPYDASTKRWQPPYVFPRKQVLAGYLLYAAIDPKTDLALVGYSPMPYNENNPLWFDVFSARTGAFLRAFKGLGKGYVNGMAIDGSTHIMCTTSADMGVAFTDVRTGKGLEVQIPGGGGALTGGAAVAADPIHHLFLVAQLNSTFSQGSTVIVYDEQGDIVEVLNGFNFLNQFSPVVVHLAVNPAERIGFVPAPQENALQSFTY